MRTTSFGCSVFLMMGACEPAVKNERSCYLSDTTVEVKSCYDGDSCLFTTPYGFTIRARLAGIDAPEMRGKLGPQAFAKAARDYLRALAVGQVVRIRLFGEDHFHRTLVELLDVEGVSINQLMIQNGYAEMYRGPGFPDHLDREQFSQAEAIAKAAQKNIWSLPSYESPKSYRARSKHR